MKKLLLTVLMFTIVLFVTAQKDPVIKPATVPIKSLLDSFSYMAGYNVATNMRQQGITEMNTALFKKGIEDCLKNQACALVPEVGNKSLQRQIDKFNLVKAAADKKKTDADKALGVAYLETNKKRKEIITLPDGLQYEIVKQGDSIAHKPGPQDTVVVNYIGTGIDGHEFDNSYKHGQPAIFTLGRVIKGWAEILQMMPVGSHWKVYIPTELAYADNPPPGSGIAPGATLIFDILLEGIKPFVQADKQ